MSEDIHARTDVGGGNAMTDLIIGMGEVGSALKSLLEERKIETLSYDITDEIIPEYESPDFLHICIPYSEEFAKHVTHYITTFNPRAVIIHSTVKVGTTAIISQYTEGKIPIFYSPIRGVHERFLQDLKRYDKFIAPNFEQYHDMLKERFQNLILYDSPDSLELAKVMETTYYGFLIAFRKDVDKRFGDMKLDSNIFWDFCKEIDELIGGRPVFWNDGEPIGGHCVIPNLALLPDNFSEYKEYIGRWRPRD